MVSPRHPLVESMAAAARLGGYFALPVTRPGEEGWTSAAGLFLGDGRRLENLVVGLRGSGPGSSSNRHVVNSAFLVAYLSRVVFPVVGQYALARRVPDVSLSNLSFHWRGGGIDATGLDRPSFAALAADPEGRHRDGLAVPSEAALYRQLKKWLFEENLGIVIPALRQQAGASLKVSWNAVAASFSQALNRLYGPDGGPGGGGGAGPVVLRGPGIAAAQAVDDGGVPIPGPHRVLFPAGRLLPVVAVPHANDYCSNCVLLPREGTGPAVPADVGSGGLIRKRFLPPAAKGRG